jgi:predicted metal-dependent peptidase
MAFNPKLSKYTAAQRIGLSIGRATGMHGKMPYLGATARMLIRRETTEIPTLGVSKNGVLSYNPEFVQECSDDKLDFIMLHECMHVACNHHRRAVAMGISSVKDFRVANIAMDACINEALREASYYLDEYNGITPEVIGQPGKMAWEARYQHLDKLEKTLSKLAKDGKEGPGAGDCGSCAGNSQEGEPSDGDGDGEGRSETEMRAARTETARAIAAQGSKGRGTVPGMLQDWAATELAPPKIDWRRHMRHLIRNAIAYRPDAIDITYRRMSRRQAGLGYGMGKPIAPAWYAPVPKIGVILDTSGSMYGLFEAAYSEIAGILRAVGAEILEVDCDAESYGVRRVNSMRDLRERKGGGGTDMRPAFEALEKLGRGKRPEIVICVTDGYMEDGIPSSAPTWCKTIFALVGANAPQPCEWGSHVRVDEK